MSLHGGGLPGSAAAWGLLALIASIGAAGESSARTAQDPFDEHFITKTMRVDYFHTGRWDVEIVSLDRVVSDGAWAGSLTRLVDDTNLGKYLFEVIDPGTNRVIYSRGFASIYGEWETTAQARSVYRTFHESLRFPWPRRPVQIVLKKRDDRNAFHEIWSTTVDPDSRFVNAADPAPRDNMWAVLESGPPTEKVDVVLLGEGYTADQMEKFHADARRLVEVLFTYEPFKSRRSDFNVWAVDLPASRSGVHRPHAGEPRRTPVSTQYNIFDSERYMLTFDNRSLREALSGVPYEFLEILANEDQYGGGGIYNFQSTTAVDTEFADYIFVHEFGHHFAGLADEYYTSDVAYQTGGVDHPEPWERNATAFHDPADLKWGDLVEADVPLPTPWAKDEFEAHAREIRARRQELIDRNAPAAEFDALFREQRQVESDLLAAMPHAEQVGAFEGASYEAHGLYRPEVDCIMFSRNDVGFCRVCQRALVTIIDLYSR
jgi:hypothetical protein